MKAIWEQLIDVAKSYTDFKSKYNISAFNEKTNFFGLFFYCFLETTKLMRLFSVNLPAMFIMQFFAWPIFRLTLLIFRPQKRDKQLAPRWP